MAITAVAATIPYLFSTFKSKNNRIKNTAFEFTTLILAYCFLAFNIVTTENNYELGYFVNGILGLYVAANSIAIFIKVLIKLKQRIRRYCFIRAYKKGFAEREFSLDRHNLRQHIRRNRRNREEEAADISIILTSTSEISGDDSVE